MAKQPFIIDGEEWRDVPEFGGEIQVSSLGRIRRIRIYNPSDMQGYARVSIPYNDRYYQKNVHQLVCPVFNGPKPRPDMVVAHLNGVRDDNRPENLMWATHKINASHKVLHGTHSRGEQNYNIKIKEADAIKMRAAPMTLEQKKAEAARLGITVGHINDIIKGRCWRHL